MIDMEHWDTVNQVRNEAWNNNDFASFIAFYKARDRFEKYNDDGLD